ncbi:MAG: hypothetical protein Q8S73_09255, partial [Deltaproteobacteria bacterium]|nr:hypothetical protein [Deltaproteobacteria bacterium]
MTTRTSALSIALLLAAAACNRREETAAPPVVTTVPTVAPPAMPDVPVQPVAAPVAVVDAGPVQPGPNAMAQPGTEPAAGS